MWGKLSSWPRLVIGGMPDLCSPWEGVQEPLGFSPSSLTQPEELSQNHLSNNEDLANRINKRVQ